MQKDIYELEIISKAQRIGGLAAVCTAFVLMAAESAMLDYCRGLWGSDGRPRFYGVRL